MKKNRASIFKKRSISKGFSFGLTSGVIGTLGMMVGLNSATQSKLAVVAGILSMAISDGFSDAFGIHISEEAEAENTEQIWTATFYTFFAKLIFGAIFVVPFIFLDISAGVRLSIAAGFLIISAYSWIMAKKQKKAVWKVVGEHLGISILVVILTSFLGRGIRYAFQAIF